MKKLLKDIIPVIYSNEYGKLSKEKDNVLNVDTKVYRSHGKMRCVNAWKTEDDMERINKLEVGNIIDTFIHYIPKDCKLLENLEEESKEKTKKNPKENPTRLMTY